MIEPSSQRQLRQTITNCVFADRGLLDQLREEIRPLAHQVRRIQPRNGTAVSLVGTDGGNNQLAYDPFLIQLVRVVDSSNNEYCLEAITPTLPIAEVSRRQFDAAGNPITALGRMMEFLGVNGLEQLARFIEVKEDGTATSSAWVREYRELVEWAVLFSLIRERTFGTDTLIVMDGLLRSPLFANDLFRKLLQGIEEAIDHHFKSYRRRIYLVGIAKHSKVLDRYRLAMALEKVLSCPYPAYIPIPVEFERTTYSRVEYARGQPTGQGDTTLSRFAGGKMVFAKFGSHAHDPIWPVDIFLPQQADTPIILGHLLADAVNGFPVPFYPLCLQRAHEYAALVDFDLDILQDQIIESIRTLLDTDAPILDSFRLQIADPAQARY
jgi:hypothetical protein